MKWEWFWARKTGPSGAPDGAEKGGRMVPELERGKRQAANNGCWEPWRTRSSAGGQEGRKGKACPSLLEAARVHRATSSPPQLKAFYCLPCSCGFSRQKRLCYGGAWGPGSSCERVDFLVAAGLLWRPRWDPSVCSLLSPVFHLRLTEYIL